MGKYIDLFFSDKPGLKIIIQLFATQLPVRADFIHKFVESRAVIMLFKVAKLMQDDVIDAGQGRRHQFNVEVQPSFARAAAPTAFQHPSFPFGGLLNSDLLNGLHAERNPFRKDQLSLQPVPVLQDLSALLPRAVFGGAETELSVYEFCACSAG